MANVKMPDWGFGSGGPREKQAGTQFQKANGKR